MSNQHTLSVLVENKPGVLTRVAALFARRSFNILSLAVGETEKPEISRITIVVDVSEVPLDQVTKQLNKLINVLKIVELEPEKTVERELMLIKVGAANTERTAVLQIVDLAKETLIIESIGSPSKHQALLRELAPYGLREIVQSGNVAIGRGSRSITDQI